MFDPDFCGVWSFMCCCAFHSAFFTDYDFSSPQNRFIGPKAVRLKPNRNSRSEKRKNTPRGCVFLFGCGDGIWTSWPSGYEPDELPDCSTPRYNWCRKPGSNRYEKKSHGILSPGRLPIPPFRHVATWWFSALPIYYIINCSKSQYLLWFFWKNGKKSIFHLDIAEKVWYHI